jgi:hypothetical protein
MTVSHYQCWESVAVGNACMLDPIEGVDRSYELLKGVPQTGRFASTALFRMSADYPRNIGLTDCLANLNDLLVASKRLKEFLEARKLPNLEYHPVSILDHKGRVASSEYFLVHPIHPQDCLDLKASNPRYNKIDPTMISQVQDLVIDESKIAPGVRLFRLVGFGKPLIVQRDLAAELSQAGFVGPVFIELNRFDK